MSLAQVLRVDFPLPGTPSHTPHMSLSKITRRPPYHAFCGLWTTFGQWCMRSSLISDRHVHRSLGFGCQLKCSSSRQSLGRRDGAKIATSTMVLSWYACKPFRISSDPEARYLDMIDQESHKVEIFGMESSICRFIYYTSRSEPLTTALFSSHSDRTLHDKARTHCTYA